MRVVSGAGVSTLVSRGGVGPGGGTIVDTPSRRSVVFSGGWWLVVREVWCELRGAAAVVCFSIPLLAPKDSGRKGDSGRGGEGAGRGSELPGCFLPSPSFDFVFLRNTLTSFMSSSCLLFALNQGALLDDS